MDTVKRLRELLKGGAHTQAEYDALNKAAREALPALLDVAEAAKRLLDALEPHSISEEYELAAALARLEEKS